MSKIDFTILDKLEDNDLDILYQVMDFDKVIGPIKYNRKDYSKYVPMLGRMKENTTIVQKNLPIIAKQCFKKKDINYIRIYASAAQRIKLDFLSYIQEYLKQLNSYKSLISFTTEDYKALLEKIIYNISPDYDIDLFYLQLKLNDINLKEKDRETINNKWISMREIKQISLEFTNNYKQELKSIDNKLEYELSNQKAVLLTKINSLEKEVYRLDKEFKRNDEIFEEIEKRNQNAVIRSSKYDKLNNELIKLRCEITSLVENNELEKEFNEFKDKIENLEDKVNIWDKHISYFISNIEHKISEFQKEFILLENSYNSEIAATKEIKSNAIDLFIKKGCKVDELETCKSYEEYIILVETNLSYIIDNRTSSNIYDCFNSAFDVGLNPLICGFGARQMAFAMTSARYGEESEVISIPVGYNNTTGLMNAILNANTDTVIVEDAFGTMNEVMILPILRSKINKKIIFTAESTEVLQYVQRYLFNYIQIIVNDVERTLNNKSFLYSNANHHFGEKVYSKRDNGHKLARTLLNRINIGNPFILTRGNIFCRLLELNPNKSDGEVIETYIRTELKWMIGEEQYEEILEFLESNNNILSQELIKSMRK